MDYAPIASRTEDCASPRSKRRTFWTSALDAYEGRRVEILADALDRAKLIRRSLRVDETSKSEN